MADYKSDLGAVSYSKLIGLDTENASPPTHAYINPDDVLHVFIASSLTSPTVRVFARLLLPDGTIVPNAWTYNPVNGRLGQSFLQTLTECFLLTITVDVPNGTTTGQTFVRVSILRGSFNAIATSALLLQGYASGTDLLSWPMSPCWPKFYGHGNIRSITGTTPAAGQQIVETVPAGAIWRLMAFHFVLTASAAVSTRVPYLVLTDGTNAVAAITTPAADGITAGGTRNYYFADNVGPSISGTIFSTGNVPREFYMQPGWRIASSVTPMDAADQLSAVQYVVEEWMTG